MSDISEIRFMSKSCIKLQLIGKSSRSLIRDYISVNNSIITCLLLEYKTLKALTRNQFIDTEELL